MRVWTVRDGDAPFAVVSKPALLRPAFVPGPAEWTASALRMYGQRPMSPEVRDRLRLLPQALQPERMPQFRAKIRPPQPSAVGP